MCGIFGSIGNSGLDTHAVYLHHVTQSIRKLSIRGEDQHGVSIFHKQKAYHVHNEGSPEGFTLSNYTNRNLDLSVDLSALPTVVLAQSRAKPAEELDEGKVLQAPYLSKDKTICAVHNGLIYNDRELAKLIQHIDLENVYPDSAIIPDLIEHLNRKATMRYDSIQTAFHSLKGSFAIILYDSHSQTLHAATNFMPLYWTKWAGHYFVASLPEMLPTTERGATEISPYTHVAFDSKRTLPTSQPIRSPNLSQKVVVSFSGGLDSCTNARLYQALGYKVHLVNFMYGQAAQEVEREMAGWFSKRWEMPLTTFDLTSLFGILTMHKPSRLLDGSKEPDNPHLDAESTLSYVPNRNMIFASIITGLAESLGASRAVVNMNLGDSKYPDNGLPFMVNVDKAIKVSLKPESPAVKFTSPLINLEKHEIVKLGTALHVDWKHSVSCYHPVFETSGYPNNVPSSCGKCGSCETRNRAFYMNELQDPADYSSPQTVHPAPKDFEQNYFNRAELPHPKIQDTKAIPFIQRIINYI